MSLLDRYGDTGRSAYDELVGDDGTPRPGWDALDLGALDAAALGAARGHASRLLEDDGVTYQPPVDGAGPGRWRLDPVPSVLDAGTWALLERGLVQRAELFETILADLYGPRRLLSSGLVPPELVWAHDAYLRAAWGATPGGRRHLVLSAADLGRSADGGWQVITDRTQAPSGLGYAMENRRVVARVLPEAYRGAPLQRLSTFFATMRDALVEAAPSAVEDPRVVVLTPGRHSETAFDQAFLASLLGFPLVTGGDLTVREGRVWMRELDELRPVDVVIRRLDDTWCDPLELRPRSELGVSGLLEAARRGSVTLANALGTGVVENPALHALLPRLCEALLDEALRLPSVTSWWCGDPAGRAYVKEHLHTLRLRPTSRAAGAGAWGPGLSAAELAAWQARIDAAPGQYVGQEVLALSTTPAVAADGLVPRRLTLRAFAVARDSSYVVMPGGLGRVLGPRAQDAERGDTGAVSKDVWVLRGAGIVPDLADRPARERTAARRSAVAMVPRALEDLFWFGRYAERTEDTVRLLLALRSLVDDHPLGLPDDGGLAVATLVQATTHLTGTYPGPPATGPDSHARILDDLRSMLLDSDRVGTVAHSLAALAGGANSVRDQLSADVFLVLGSVDRARGRLAGALEGGTDDGWLDTGVQVLSGILALAGITGENMVRDVGWHLLDIGRGIERALNTLTLLRWVFEEARAPAVESHLVTCVLTANESILTHRRRYGAAQRLESTLDLLVADDRNPRAVAFQVDRIAEGLRSLPGSSEHGRLEVLLEEIRADLQRARATHLAEVQTRAGGDGVLLGARREHLVDFSEGLQERLRGLADAVAAGYFWHPSAPRPMDGVLR